MLHLLLDKVAEPNLLFYGHPPYSLFLAVLHGTLSTCSYVDYLFDADMSPLDPSSANFFSHSSPDTSSHDLTVTPLYVLLPDESIWQ
jgi:hypothetical protein